MELSNTLAARAYSTSRPATSPVAGSDAESILGDMAQGFATTLQQSETAAMDAMTTGSDPHALVQALAQTELAVETAVTIRNKVVEAYQEILRMPV